MRAPTPRDMLVSKTDHHDSTSVAKGRLRKVINRAMRPAIQSTDLRSAATEWGALHELCLRFLYWLAETSRMIQVGGRSAAKDGAGAMDR
jgi:hypothetical protein